MKKILLLSTLLLSFSSSQEKTENEPVPAAVTLKPDRSHPEYEETKATLDELFFYAELLKKGEISENNHAALSYLVGQRFTAQRAALNKADREKLKIYSNERFEEIYPKKNRIIVETAFGSQKVPFS